MLVAHARNTTARGRFPALLLGLGLLAGCAREASLPNLCLISVDTLNRSAVRAFNPDAPELPGFDRLAREGTVFSNAVTPSSWTLPAHASLLSGLYPDRHGATDKRTTLLEASETLAEALAERGYRTAGFTGGGFLHRRFGLGRGFQQYFDAGPPLAGDPADATGATPYAELDQALRFLEEKRGDAPFFLFLHTFYVHDYFTDASSQAEALSCIVGKQRCPEERWVEIRALYTRRVREFDLRLGELLSLLDQRGFADTTYVMLVSDHGEGFDPASERIHHGGRLTPELLRIPMFVRGPGVPRGRIEVPVSLVDVMPTLLDLAGVPVPADLDGGSLSGVLRGAAPGVSPEVTPEATREVYAMEHFYRWRDGRRKEVREVLAHALQTAVVDDARWYVQQKGAELTLDLAGAPVAPALCDDLRTLAAERARERPPTPAPVEDDRLTRQLEALGYAGEDD